MTDNIFDTLDLDEPVQAIDALELFPKASFGAQFKQASRYGEALVSVVSSFGRQHIPIRVPDWNESHILRNRILEELVHISVVHREIGAAPISLEPLDLFENELEAAFGALPTVSIDPEFLTPSPHTRAVTLRIVRGIAHAIFESSGHTIDVPGIDAVTDGGIDVHWTRDNAELFVHIPPGEAPDLEFYGYRTNKSSIIKGHSRVGDRIEFLMNWLLAQ